jgi:hypothetical protein
LIDFVPPNPWHPAGALVMDHRNALDYVFAAVIHREAIASQP